MNTPSELVNTDTCYKIGVITRTHGTRGELSMNFTDDVWDRADASYVFLMIDGILVPFFLEAWRFRSDSVALLKFQDIDTSESAQEWVGCEVWFPHSLTPEPTDADTYTWRSFTGWTIIDQEAGELGTIDHVEDTTANTLFCVGTHLIPANEAFITSIDAKTRTIHTKLPQGLLEL